MAGSLRGRTLGAFVAFAAAVSGLFVIASYVGFQQAGDAVLDQVLAGEARRVLEHRSARGELPPPTSTVRAYDRAEALPPDVRAAAAGLGPGRHELDLEDEVLLAIEDVRDGGQPVRLYVVFRMTDPEPGRPTWVVLLGLGLLILGAGVGLGLYTAGRIVRPLEALGRIVEQSPPDRLAEALAASPADAEVRALTGRLRDAVVALDAYAEREQSFTRFASHELRTPTAVVRGAAELLRATEEAALPRVSRPLERIERAAADMEAILESLLWLARERSRTGTAPPVAVTPLVEKVVERHRALLSGKEVEVAIERSGAPEARAPAAAVEMVIGNLVENAFRWTERGSVTVRLEDDRVTITDTGPGMAEEERRAATRAFVRGAESPGAGLGLALVSALCERFDWTLRLDGAPGEGTTAEVRFAR
jgi:signal transduction histidine kinase